MHMNVLMRSLEMNAMLTGQQMRIRIRIRIKTRTRIESVMVAMYVVEISQKVVRVPFLWEEMMIVMKFRMD